MQVVIRIKDGYTLADVAAEINTVFGYGGDVDADRPELFLGMVNTPPVMGYVRIAFDDVYMPTLQTAAPLAQTCEVISYGPEPYIAGYVDGEPVYCGQIA